MVPKNHPFAKEKHLKKTPDPFLSSMFIFRICILQNPEKSAEICKWRVIPIFWRHCNVVSEESGYWRWSRFAMMAPDIRRRHAMPTKTDEGRNLATYSTPPKFNMEPGNFLVSKFGISFSKGPPFSGELCLFRGDVFSNINGTGLLTYWFIRTLEERIPF